jgi:hypothetical protein
MPVARSERRDESGNMAAGVAEKTPASKRRLAERSSREQACADGARRFVVDHARMADRDRGQS